MPPQRQFQNNKAAASTSSQASKPDRFTPFLADIRLGLGSHWILYEECIEGILEAAAQRQDTTAWFEQLQRLVSGNDQVQYSHEGVLFLLSDMGVRPSKQKRQVEGERHGRKHLSLPLSPPQANFIESALSSTADKDFSHALSASNISFNPMSGQSFNSRRGQSFVPEQGQSSISKQDQTSNSRQGQTFSSRQDQTNLPVLAQWPAPTSSARMQQESRNKVLKLRTKGLPFDFSARGILPELTYPRDLEAFFNPPDDIMLDPDRWVPRVYPFVTRSNKNVFFEDPMMKVKVAHMFGYSVRWREGIPDGPDERYIREINRLPYEPEEDDLASWAAKLEGSTEGKDEQMKPGDHITQWPLWKKHYGMDL